jgi:FkbM family methyltransferase
MAAQFKSGCLPENRGGSQGQGLAHSSKRLSSNRKDFIQASNWRHNPKWPLREARLEAFSVGGGLVNSKVGDWASNFIQFFGPACNRTLSALAGGGAGVGHLMKRSTHDQRGVRMRAPLDYAYLGNGVGVTKTHRGHRIFVYTKDFGLTPHIVMNGVWEWGIEHAILKLLRRGSRVVEVGCNMGYHTLAMADVIGPEGKLFGFEANPEIFSLLRWSIDHNGFLPRVQLYNHAVTEVPGDVKFSYDPAAIGGGHVIGDNSREGINVISVPGIPLDKTLVDISNVDLLRMDAEGFEPFIIKGARGLIERSPEVKIVVEWSVRMMGSRLNVGDFVKELEATGFSAWKIDGDSNFNFVAMPELVDLPHCEVTFSRSDISSLNTQ